MSLPPHTRFGEHSRFHVDIPSMSVVCMDFACILSGSHLKQSRLKYSYFVSSSFVLFWLFSVALVILLLSAYYDGNALRTTKNGRNTIWNACVYLMCVLAPRERIVQIVIIDDINTRGHHSPMHAAYECRSIVYRSSYHTHNIVVSLYALLL